MSAVAEYVKKWLEHDDEGPLDNINNAAQSVFPTISNFAKGKGVPRWKYQSFCETLVAIHSPLIDDEVTPRLWLFPSHIKDLTVLAAGADHRHIFRSPGIASIDALEDLVPESYTDLAHFLLGRLFFEIVGVAYQRCDTVYERAIEFQYWSHLPGRFFCHTDFKLLRALLSQYRFVKRHFSLTSWNDATADIMLHEMRREEAWVKTYLRAKPQEEQLRLVSPLWQLDCLDEASFVSDDARDDIPASETPEVPKTESGPSKCLTDAEIGLGRRVLKEMSVINPKITAFRNALRAQGGKMANGRVGDLLELLLKEKK